MRRALALLALTVYLWAPGSASAGPGGASGPITVDSTPFVAGSSVMGTDGGVYSDTLPPIASTTTAAFRMTKYRAEHVNLRDINGAALGVSGNPLFTSGSTTVQISTVQVVNSTVGVVGSVGVIGTVPVSGTFWQATQPVSVSGTLNTVVTNAPTVFLATTSVSGSTVTVNGTITAVPTGTQNVYVLNPTTTTITGPVDVTHSTVTITNTGFAVTNSPAVTISNTPNVYVTNPTTTTITGAVSVTGSTVTVNGTVTALPSGTQNVYLVNPATTTVSGAVSVTGSTVTVNGTVSIGNAPNVNVVNSPTVTVGNNVPVTVTSTNTVIVQNSSFSVTGSTVNIQGTVPVTFSGTQNTYVVNMPTVTINGTPTVNAAQSGSWFTTTQVLNPSASPTSVGYSFGATQMPVSISDGVLVASNTAVAGKNGLNVNIIGGAGAGGTSSNYAATFPNAGNPEGYVGPTGLMQAGRVDVSSNIYVNVANTELSVTGSTVTVNGTVSISTNTPFNVNGSTVGANIIGTVPVNVSNTPNVSVTNTPNVSVTNTVGTTLTAQLPTGVNNIGTVSGSTVTISGSIPATITGTVNTYQTNPSTITFNGVAQPVTAAQTGTWNVNSYVTNPTTTTITGAVSVTGSTVTVSPQGGSMAVTGTFFQSVQPVYVNNPTTTTITGTVPVSIAAPVTVLLATTSVNGSTIAVTNVSGQNLNVAATQSGSWSTTDTQSSARWNVSFDTRTTTAVLSSTGVTTNVAISTPVAGLSSQTVRVFRLMITVDAATTITFRDGSTNFGDSQYLAANGSIVLDLSNEPWYITSSSNGFVVKQSGSANMGIRIWYTQS